MTETFDRLSWENICQTTRRRLLSISSLYYDALLQSRIGPTGTRLGTTILGLCAARRRGGACFAKSMILFFQPD